MAKELGRMETSIYTQDFSSVMFPLLVKARPTQFCNLLSKLASPSLVLYLLTVLRQLSLLLAYLAIRVYLFV